MIYIRIFINILHNYLLKFSTYLFMINISSSKLPINYQNNTYLHYCTNQIVQLTFIRLQIFIYAWYCLLHILILFEFVLFDNVD